MPVITLETTPDSVQNTLPLTIGPAVEDDGTICIRDEETGHIKGLAVQAPNARAQVRFFSGKGGFCAIVNQDDLIYLGLPGGKIELPGTSVDIPGEWVKGRDASKVPTRTHTPTQTVTKQAMILGAGLATRFEPVSGDTTGYPKPGVPLLGEVSVIYAIAEHLKAHGIERILINTYYKPQVIKAQLAELSGVEVVYIDEDQPSGTAGGLAKALEMGIIDMTQPIFVVQGDAITDADISHLLNTHVAQNAAVTIGGQIVSDDEVHLYGIIETDAAGQDGQSGNITMFKEKPSLADAANSRFANAGFYILAPEVMPLLLHGWQRHKGMFDYAQHFFPLVLGSIWNNQLFNATSGDPMRFWAEAVGGYWNDIGNPRQYLESLADMAAGLVETLCPKTSAAFYDNGVVYWPNTRDLADQQQAKLTGNVIVTRRYAD